jgi:carbonic anhydrase
VKQAAEVKSLIEGIERYERLHRPHYSERFAALAGGQTPLALFLTCSDSRVVPNLVASADPGELFVVRNVANLVPPDVSNELGAGGDASVAAAVWYALEVLGVREIIVCGHSGCGGVKALLAPEPPPSPALRRWLAPAESSLEIWRRLGPFDPAFPPHDQLSQVTTRHQLDNLRTYSFVQDRAERGDVRLHAWWFDIRAGRMLAYSEQHGRYVPAVEVLADLVEPALDVA